MMISVASFILYRHVFICTKCIKDMLTQFIGGVPSVPVLLPPEGNVLRWESLDDNGAEILQLIVTFKRY